MSDLRSETGQIIINPSWSISIGLRTALFCSTYIIHSSSQISLAIWHSTRLARDTLFQVAAFI